MLSGINPKFVCKAGGIFSLFVTLGLAPGARGADAAKDYLVVYRSPAAINRTALQAQGHRVTRDLSAAGVMVVHTSDPATLAATPGVIAVAPDGVHVRIPPREQVVPAQARAQASPAGGCASESQSCGQQWDLDRIHVPHAWRATRGSPDVRVAILDTGLRSTHEEVGANYDKASSRSFVQPNQFCTDDAATYNSLEDFSGHGTWTALHIGGKNGAVMTGIAPKATIINVRVLGACGFGLDSWILTGMLYANTVGAQVISMSLGGYVCRDGVVPGSFYCGTEADAAGGTAIWQAYAQVIDYLRQNGTLVIAAAGNDHVRLGANGRVVNAGSLAFNSANPDPANDLRGLSEVPAGTPGAIAVAAINRKTAKGSTLFGQYGVGWRDQLTYYSSYGERVNISAPGGARNDNVPKFDCGDPDCARLESTTPDATDDPGDFGAWGTCDNCYAYVQGTSMATPQVAGVAALALSTHPSLSADMLADLLKRSVSPFENIDATPPIAGNPASKWYNFDINYDARGLPHLFMGSGVIDAARAAIGY